MKYPKLTYYYEITVNILAAGDSSKMILISGIKKGGSKPPFYD